jgi:hypothetical protein
LESAFVNFGVAPKQKDKARLAFEKSAQSAGFFQAGKDRLVEPILSTTVSHRANGKTNPSADAKDSPPPPPIEGREHAYFDRADPLKEPLIHGLLARLPEAGTEWDYDQRLKWVRLFTAVLDMVYTTPSLESGSITYLHTEKAQL